MSRIRAALETRSYPIQFTTGDVVGSTGWGPGMVWRGGTSQGIDQALRLSAVFACLRILSEAISTLPFDTYLRFQGTRRVYRPRPAFMDFAHRSRIDYLSQIVLSMLTDGNAYVFLVRDPLGGVIDSIVLDPGMVAVARNRAGQVEYRVQSKLMDPLEIMHIKGMSLPGQITGLSPIGYARESIGLGLATQRFGAGFFENGALPGAVLEAPGKFSPDAAKMFAEMWNDNHQGIGNAHKVGVLTEGAKLSQVSITPEDSQFIETRRFQVPDIARIYGVPPHLIADAERSTSWGSGLAEQNMSFGQYTLRPLCERIEEGHTSLMPGLGLPDVFTKLNLDALLRAALKERYDSYAVGINTGFMVPNEARKLEDLPPLPGGDVVKPPQPASLTPEPQTKSTFGGGA